MIDLLWFGFGENIIGDKKPKSCIKNTKNNNNNNRQRKKTDLVSIQNFTQPYMKRGATKS